MATTYKLIDKAILSSSQASVDFTSINSSYTDLIFVLSVRTDTSAELYGQINNSGGGYTNQFISGNGSSTGAGTYQTAKFYLGEAEYSSQTANTFSSHQIYLPNYAGSNYKSLSTESVQETNATTAYSYMIASLWSYTDAISSFKFTISSGNFVSGSSFYLYGIKNS